MSDASRQSRGARLDEAIDGAVREMLDVEPRADLRARVMDGLAASGPVRGDALFGVGRNRLLVFAAAAAAIVLAVFVARRSEPIAPPSTVVGRATDTRLPAEKVAAPDPPIVDATLTPPRATAAEPARHAAPRLEPTVAAASFEADGGAMPPLTSIPPIAVAPIVESSIAPADIAVRPLSPITEMQIAPLTPPDRR
jgi:hypothetical protein